MQGDWVAPLRKTVYKITRDRFVLRCFMMRSLFGVFLSLCFLVSTTYSQSNPCSLSDHSEYTKKIKEFTTESFFSTELVDHLPLSSCVPAPDVSLHHIVGAPDVLDYRSEEHTSELQSHSDLVCRLLLEKKKRNTARSAPRVRPPVPSLPDPTRSSRT